MLFSEFAVIEPRFRWSPGLGVGPVAFPKLYGGAFLRPGDQHRPSLKLPDQIRLKITSDNVVYCQGLASVPRPSETSGMLARHVAHSIARTRG